jgi:glycerol-3-phosphate dehydrogenase (NAD(P)+)
MIVRQPSVTVLGGGSWGTTVASVAARNAPTTLWLRDGDVAESINTKHENPRYLPGLELPAALCATSSLAEAVADADVLVVGVPSQHVRPVLSEVAEHVRPWIPVISLVKGLEQTSRKRITEVIDETLPGHPAGVLAGPNVAREILAGYAAAATIAMPDHRSAQLLQGLFNTQRFRVYTSDDVLGVEIAGALKNVFAIAVGMGDGLGAGDNTRAMVITRALREMTRLGTAIGGTAQTFAGLAGMGDLIATCTSPHSRNHHVGVELGRGKPLEQIIAEMDQVAEGVKSAGVVADLASVYGIEMRIAREVDAVINHGRPVVDTYRGLLRSAPGHEVHGEAW